MNNRLVLTLGCGLAAGLGASAHATPNPAELIHRIFFPLTLTETEANILARLVYTDLDVSFDRTRLCDALATIEDSLGFPLRLHYGEKWDEIKLDPHAEITLEREQAPALTIIETILLQATSPHPDATWQLRNGSLEIGTKIRLAAPAAQEIRYLPIRDLLMEVPWFENAPGGSDPCLWSQDSGFGVADAPPPREHTEQERAQEIIDIITEIVEPDAWEVNGGDWARVRYHGGFLIIRAPDFIHRQIVGYPIMPMPPSDHSAARRRYVTFGSGISTITVIDEEQREDGPVHAP